MRPDLGRGPAKPTTGRIPMSEFTVTRSLKDPRERVWQVLTQPSHFEGWLPAKSGTAVLDVRTGGSRAGAVISSAGGERAPTRPYDPGSQPGRLVMTVPPRVGTSPSLTSAPHHSTRGAHPR